MDAYICLSLLLRMIKRRSIVDMSSKLLCITLIHCSNAAIRISTESSYALDLADLLTSHNGDLGALLRKYRTEFRGPVEQIKQILGTHPNFVFFRKVLRHGMSCHFTRDLLEGKQVQELTLQLARGNHKSPSEKLGVASCLLNKDVAHGFSLPVHASIVPKIQGEWSSPVALPLNSNSNPMDLES
jgi:hypothetical protein